MEKSAADLLWIIVSSCLVFFMQAGFAFVESGFTRTKNSINVAIKNLTDLGISFIVYWSVGFALMFGATRSGLFGASHFFSSLDTQWLSVFFLFQAMFCSTSATIVSGAVAERMRFSMYIIATFILSSIIYPVTGHWSWGGALSGNASGWLAKMGFVDFAGSTVVHSVGGWVALAAILIIGSRTGRFEKGKPPQKINGSDIPAAVVGVVILWFGWYGFNGGSTLEFNDQVADIIINTSLAAAAGMIFTLFTGWIIHKTADVEFVTNGAIAGLVAITANCHAVTPGQSIIIGGIGGLIMLGCTELFILLRLDDAVGAIPVHLAAGIWGTLAVALFGDPDTLGTGLSMFTQLKVQFIGVFATGAWAFGVSFIIFSVINYFFPFRIDPQAEEQGLNIAEHGASTEIYDFYRILDTQAETGRFDLRVPVEPFTEIGQIARRYNNLLENIENHVVARSDYLAILDNINDGLFLLDKEMKIAGHYSKSMETIFNRTNIGQASFKTLLSDLMPDTEMANKYDYLDLLFDSQIPDETLENLNPFENLEIFIDDKSAKFHSKNIGISFRRIFFDTDVVRLMGIVKDLTEQEKLSREVDRMKQTAQTEMEMFYRIQHINPRIFAEFITQAKEGIEKINQVLSSPGTEIEKRLDIIFRQIHTLKGDAHLLELDFVSGKAHDFESMIEELKNSESISNQDFIPLAVKLSELMGLFTQLDAIGDRLNAFQCAFVEDSVGADLITWSVKSLVDRFNSERGQHTRFVFSDFHSDIIPHTMRRGIKDIFVQLARNSLSHGLESEDERERIGKGEPSIIEIKSSVKDNSLSLTLKDNGRGIDYDRLREKALHEGIISEEESQSLTNRELVGFIFQSSFSTARQVNQEAGRGIGMSVVSKILSRMNGKLIVKNTPGQSCEFECLIPLNEQ
jgi:Amt family ammonium transporter